MDWENIEHAYRTLELVQEIDDLGYSKIRLTTKPTWDKAHQKLHKFPRKMVKKDKKAKAAEKKLRTTQKQSKKIDKKEKKHASKPHGKRNEGGDDDDEDNDANIDLDAVLAAYAEQQARFVKVTEMVYTVEIKHGKPDSETDTTRVSSARAKEKATPSPRASCTIIASPAASENEIFVFGGESFNGSLATFYNDLFVYNIGRDEWRIVTSPNSPLPRSGHAWCRGGNTGGIYLFGGEFSSPKQGTFYHYRDFWHLDPSTREWTKIEARTVKGRGAGGAESGGKDKGGPSSRSGHRMTYFKNYIILFGGFQDTSQQTKYLQDLWIYDCQTFSWHSPILPPASPKPDARSSFSFLPHESGAVLFGGYSRVKVSTTKTSTKRSGANSSSGRTILKPTVHQDTWFLRIRPPSAEDPPNSLPKVHWERRKRPVNQPNPPRAGATMAYHKGRGIQFGGVHDVEESEEGIDSEFFNSLFVWNIERNRFFPLTLRRPRAQQKKMVTSGDKSKRGRAKAAEEELLRNLAALQAKGKDDAEPSAKAETVEGMEAGDEESDDDIRIEKPVIFEMPHPRFNAQATVQKDVVYIFGGTYEKGDREFTFDDMYAIDLGKLDGVKVIYRQEPENWQDVEEEEDEAEEEDEDEDDSESGESEKEGVADPSNKGAELDMRDGEAEEAASATGTSDAENEPDVPEVDIAKATESPAISDKLPHPRPFESLRDFYARTSVEWQKIVLQDLRSKPEVDSGKSVKEARKLAFEYAENMWWNVREEIQALEDEREEAGIGEVINISEKGGTPGGGRRR